MKILKKTTNGNEEVTNHMTAPEGGYGWVIVIGAMILNLFVCGAVYTFAVVYEVLIEKYQHSAAITAWVGSMANGMGLLLGPLSSALSTKFSCRSMAIVGGVIMAIGWLSTGFMPRLEYMFITYGLIAGVGMSLAYTPSIVMVGQWFDKRRALANGLTVGGSGIGTFIFAPLLKNLFQEYSFQGTMLIMSAIMLNICVCGALFRPVLTTPQKQNKEGLPEKSKVQDKALCKDNEYQNSENEQKMLLRDYIDYTLLKTPQFLCLGVSLMLTTLGRSSASVMLTSLAKQQNIAANREFLLSISGITDIIGRILFGIICDIHFFKNKRKYLYFASIFISGGATVACAFATSYWHFATFSVIFGLFAGSYLALIPVILVDLLGVEKLSSAFGLALSFEGIGFLLGPPAAGWIKDKFDNYKSTFYFAGVAMILSSIIINLPSLCQKLVTLSVIKPGLGNDNPAYIKDSSDLPHVDIKVIENGVMYSDKNCVSVNL